MATPRPLPGSAVEFRRDRFQPAGYGLRATIIDGPQGASDELAFFTWEAARASGARSA